MNHARRIILMKFMTEKIFHTFVKKTKLNKTKNHKKINAKLHINVQYRII